MVKQTDLKDLLILTGGQKYSDERGSFQETWHRAELEEYLGEKWLSVQENTAVSKKGVLRGIHAAPWTKMIYVTYGKGLSVLVDLRPSSPTFKKHQKFVLDSNDPFKLFVPPGFGNGYLALSEEVVYEYQVDVYFSKANEQGIVERGVIWSDPDLAIDWSIKEPLLSDKDKQNPTLKEFLEKEFADEILKNAEILKQSLHE